MIDSIYSKYFQKSRSFLYPALGIKKSSSFTPSGTYLSLEGKIGPDDMKLICSFKVVDSEKFRQFEEKMLLTNPLYESSVTVEDFKLYVFNYESYKSDWFNFLIGKYSKLSTVLKRAIKSYYGQDSTEYAYMDSYLYPEKYYTIYAKLLNVEVDILTELCDPCDLEKETLKLSKEKLELL